MKVKLLIPTSSLLLSVAQAEGERESFSNEAMALIKEINSVQAIMTLVELETKDIKIFNKEEAEVFSKERSLLRQRRKEPTK